MAAFIGKHVVASFPGTGNSCHRTIGRIRVLKESWPVAISMSPLLSSFLLVVFLANLFSVALIFLLKLKFVLIIDW